jgi:hypothetical protein
VEVKPFVRYKKKKATTGTSILNLKPFANFKYDNSKAEELLKAGFEL